MAKTEALIRSNMKNDVEISAFFAFKIISFFVKMENSEMTNESCQSYDVISDRQSALFTNEKRINAR